MYTFSTKKNKLFYNCDFLIRESPNVVAELNKDCLEQTGNDN